MPGLDQSKPFVPLSIAVLAVSDTRSLADDKSGAMLGRAHRDRRPQAGGARHRARTTSRRSARK